VRIDDSDAFEEIHWWELRLGTVGHLEGLSSFAVDDDWLLEFIGVRMRRFDYEGRFEYLIHGLFSSLDVNEETTEDIDEMDDRVGCWGHHSHVYLHCRKSAHVQGEQREHIGNL